MTLLFQSDDPRIYTIPPGANFLSSLAGELARRSGLRDKPEALADALIYVPNRRSERVLAFALHQASEQRACLLPDIRALGDLEQAAPPPSAEAALADLPPVISPSQRLGALTRLVLAYYDRQGLPIPAVSALSAARELARLLDQAALSGEVDWSDLDACVPEAQFAAHWQHSVQFLRIITQAWPAKLDEATAMDPYARRYAAAAAMAAHWQDHPPPGPVIIAGSTGATPASRLLMQAAMRLPQGLVVLPGLDQASPDLVWQDVARTPSHPQYTLSRTLDALSLAPHSVASWPMDRQASPDKARTRLIHEALAPASRTADWTQRLRELSPEGDLSAFVTSALKGLSLIEASDEDEEAMLAALILRETLQTSDQTAALVTPDAGLARRVSALLRQWQIDVTPSLGLPLAQSEAGSFVLLVADWLSDPSHPVKLMAVLNHALSWISETEAQQLDRRILRGPRVWNSWPALLDHAETRLTDTGETSQIMALLLSLSTALEACGELPDSPGSDQMTGPDWLKMVAALVEEVGQPDGVWTGEAGGQVATALRELSDLFSPLELQSGQVWADLLRSELSQMTFQTGQLHARLAIWGPLEARLQNADRILLAGLNEGVWPAQPAADAFLPRLIRSRIGLSDPDERIGLSAHDFAQLAAAPDVTLLYSQRREDKPAIASRWIWRLRTLVRGALGAEAGAALAPAPERDPRKWLVRLRQVPPMADDFQPSPRPCPPTEARPNRLAVTRIETLIRDPYAIYCQYVLGLRRLDPLNLPADVRSRGTAIHKALERFELERLPRTAEVLLSLVESELLRSGESEAELIGLRARRLGVCAAYLAWQEEMQLMQSGTVLTEASGQMDLEIAGRRFTLTGTADRIERRQDGAAAILDFKTGQPPTEKQVRSGLSPQMPLQGLIARSGGYADLGKVPVSALTYIRFGTAFSADELGKSEGQPRQQAVDAMIDEAQAGLVSLLTQFADPAHPYLSAPRPERVRYEGDYTRLARRAEWTGPDTYD